MGHTTCRGPREDQTKSPCSLMRTRPKNVCSPLIINVFTDTFDAFLYPRVLTVCVCVCVCVCACVLSYVWQHLDIGYVQGMCDLLAPLLVILDDGTLTLSCTLFTH